MSYHIQSEEWCGFSNQSLHGLPYYWRINFKIWIHQIWESRFNQGIKNNFVILLHANTLPRDTIATKMKKPLVISKLLVQKSNLIGSNSTFPFKKMIPVTVFTTPYNYRSTLPMINARFKPETIHFNATFNAWKKKKKKPFPAKTTLASPLIFIYSQFTTFHQLQFYINLSSAFKSFYTIQHNLGTYWTKIHLSFKTLSDGKDLSKRQMTTDCCYNVTKMFCITYAHFSQRL